jgi:hypothetical protein
MKGAPLDKYIMKCIYIELFSPPQSERWVRVPA